MVPCHQVGAEQEAVRVTADESADFIAVGRYLADLPLGGAGVERQVGVALQQLGQVVGVLWVAAHVGADPVQVREQLQHPLQAGVLFGLGAELGGVGVGAAEPGVGVGDV